MKLQFLPWKEETEIEDLQRMDIGIMPLMDDDWSRGKCGFKALLYMALGLPAVVSAIGVGTDIVEDGVNGFLARSESEWVEKLGGLLRDPDLRERLGREARRTVEAKYSVEANAPKLVEVFRAASHAGSHAKRAMPVKHENEVTAGSSASD